MSRCINTSTTIMSDILIHRSSDGDDVIRHRVDVMFEQIHMLKFRTAETLEDVIKHTFTDTVIISPTFHMKMNKCQCNNNNNIREDDLHLHFVISLGWRRR